MEERTFFSICGLPARITVRTDREDLRFDGDETVAAGDVRIRFADGGILLTADETPVCEVSLRWAVPFPEDARFCGDHWERGYGDFEWRGFRPERVMPWYFYAASGDAFAVYGVRTNPDALCYFTADPCGVTLTADVRSGGAGVVLRGKTVLCAKPYFAEARGLSPFDAARKLTAGMAEAPVFPSEPVYGYNNWYYAYGASSAETMLRSARELAALTEGLENRPFLVVDDCWQRYRPTGYIGGDWQRSNDAFPDMAAFAKETAALGVKPGIWFRPLQNRDEKIPAHCYRNRDDAILDPSVPETLAQIAADVRTFTDWGYRLIKHDYSTYDVSGGRWGKDMGARVCAENVRFADGSRTTAQIIKTLYRTIHDAAGGKALILGCNCIGHLGVGQMELNRTGDDTSGTNWERTRLMGVNTLAFRMAQHGAFFDADADCAPITDKVPWEKARQWLTLLGESGTPLFVSVAPDAMTGEQRETVRRMLRAASKKRPVAEPLDWCNNACPERWNLNGEETWFSWND